MRHNNPFGKDIVQAASACQDRYFRFGAAEYEIDNKLSIKTAHELPLLLAIVDDMLAVFAVSHNGVKMRYGMTTTVH